MDTASTSDTNEPETCEVCDNVAIIPFECEECGMATCPDCDCECETDDSWIDEDDAI